MLKKISLPILLTVMCALLLVVILLYGFNNGKFTFLQKKAGNQTAVLTKKEEKIKRTDYTEVARKTLDWIDNQRNEEGWYILERGCDYEKKTCDTVWDNKEGNKDGLIATWARLNFYEQHKDAKDLEIVKKDIDLFYDKYKDDNLKDSLWICKITYEMAQSKYLDQTQKDKLEKICFGVKFPTPEEVKEYWKSGKNEKKEKIAKSYQEPWQNWDAYVLVQRSYDVSLGYTTDLVYMYTWKKDNLYLDLAKKHLEAIKSVYGSEAGELSLRKGMKYTDDICLLGISSLDLYSLEGKNKEDIVYVEKIYDEVINLPGNKGEYLTPICGLLIKKLYQITNNKKYLSDLEINNSNLIKIYLDGQRVKNTNDFGFFMSNDKNNYVPFKNVVENGLIVEMLID